MAVGTVLCSIVESESIGKCHKFLQAIQSGRGVESCLLKVVANGRTRRLWLSASDHAGSLEIAGASTPEAAAEIRRAFLERGYNADRSADKHSPRQNGVGSLLQRNVELESLNSEKTRWLLTAAHDLRNQLNAIQAYTDLLFEADGLQTDLRKMVEGIHVSTEYMLHQLNDLGEIALTESGNSWLRLAPTVLLPLLEESISLSRPYAERKGTTLHLEYQDVPPVTIDYQKLRQVFRNLLDNAIKYSQKGAKVEIVVVPQQHQVLISVRDNGLGIPLEELNSIFTPFQKTRARAQSPDPGTGLGLAICKRIVEQHGGWIWAESIFGEGATFHVALPCGQRDTNRKKS